MDCERIIKQTEDLLMSNYQITLKEANSAQLHECLGLAVMNEISPLRIESRKKDEQRRRAYYLSAEYLMGRMVYNNLNNLKILDKIKELFLERGVDISCFEDIEDVAMGNGGLGRLAACFLDSTATHDIPLDGYGIRYRFGLFKQEIKDGFQSELADNWQRFGDPWSKRRDDRAVTVVFADAIARAVPYDMPIIGYGFRHIGTLRAWQSEAVNEFNFDLFNNFDYESAVREKNAIEDITRVLYPNDSSYEGKRLRLKQQYFLSSASMQDIVRRYKRTRGNDMSGFSAHCAIQLNDTHPTVSIPELIRLLMREGLSFDASFDTACRTFSYTNHTIMSEALESWDVNLFKSVIPEIYDIICRINDKLNATLYEKHADRGAIENMQIIHNNQIRMANLATFVSSYVNGVARIHTEILKNSVLHDWYVLFPDRFKNKTNGITQRRFLSLANPELTELLTKTLGSDGFITDLSQISALKDKIDDELIDEFIKVKYKKKEQLSRHIERIEGIYLPPYFAYDVQVKRMHEYKRQLLNAFSILYIYFKLKSGDLKDFPPTAFIFGAKAAPGYVRAKGIIKFINEVAAKVNSDPDVRELIRVVFVRNYNCSLAEKIIPAADISEQISPAGTEASGTGNMKLMLNGAVTLGTYDGANIEIVEQAGIENNYIFGADVNELNAIRNSYNPMSIYERDEDIRRIVNTLVDNTFSDSGQGIFRELYNSLLYGASWHKPDHYFLLHDFRSYVDTKLRAIYDYANLHEFSRKCLMNTASAGVFSADRTVKEYAEEIWHIG